jgi:hypothetical protein
MVSRLDVLMSLGLDKDTLSDAAAIDDALQAQEKAAQQTLDATDAAISGLSKRHGGIKEAVDDAPVDKPAEPEFYQDLGASVTGATRSAAPAAPVSRLSGPCSSGVPSWCAMCELGGCTCPCHARR